ncbi:MAG: OB-fold nucleic acid binding domain-containing protein [Actinomycetota bacterium]|nr:OB-fold nucleic acid binding domain-containing protein [Actinomycetota bacterium]
MALKKMVGRLTKPVEEQDREKLVRFCDALGVTHCDEVQPRVHTRVAGEVSSVRVVPRAGAPSLEVTVTDGRGSVVGVFFGRRRLAGLTPGRRLVLEGVAAPQGKRCYMYNPVYELLG